MDLTEAEDIKRRWQEYTELYKKDLHDQDNHDGVIIHPEPDILESKVKGALGSITTNKASGGDGIPVELFQILVDLENSAMAAGLEKVRFHSNPKERQHQGMLKICMHMGISHTSKGMLKILQARLQQYVNCELPNLQVGFRKGRGTRDQIAKSVGS